MNTQPASLFWYIFLAVWLVIALQTLWSRSVPPAEQIPYSQFQTYLRGGCVNEVHIAGDRIEGTLKDPPAGKGKHFVTVRIDPELAQELAQYKIAFLGERKNTWLRAVLSWTIPVLLFFGLWAFLLRRMAQKGGLGGGGFMAIGKSKAKIYMEKEVKVSFDDVAGVDEAKAELQEVIEFLKTPEKFRRLDGKIPKGILLVGPPGTGKTLLARAVAGEAGVPFFSISGSEFVEMFVGVGAARVRDLFLQAKEKAPCIIFIDELDALGKARGMGPIGHEEREQTLNQLLVEMDGFDPRLGVILVAATNRPEILDPALLRAGRFDRQVLVDRPDKEGRLAILRLHARGIPLAPEVNLEVIAALNKQEKERVAHHEVGHALVALALPGGGTVQKISIIPRGVAALGYTLQLPTEDRFLMTKSELENKIAVLLGGRVAEELVFHEISTGARDDRLKATEIAKNMVKSYGMSEQLGKVSFDSERQSLFLQGQQPRTGTDYSEVTAREIDAEIREIVETQYRRATRILGAQQETLREGAAVLLLRETISGDELQAIASRQNGCSQREANGIAVIH